MISELGSANKGNSILCRLAKSCRMAGLSYLIAASFSPCASNLCFAFCSCTSCALQKGHQSAERKKRSTVPFDPLSVALDCLWPNSSPRTKPPVAWPISPPPHGATHFLLSHLSLPL